MLRAAPACRWVLCGALLMLHLVMAAENVTRAAGLAQSDAAAQLVVDGWHHRVWVVYPVEKVRADEELPHDRPGRAPVVTAARREHEPLVLVLRAEVPLREVTVAFHDLHGPADQRLPATCFSAWRIGYVYVDEPSGARIPNPMPYPTGTGLYPDPLLSGPGVARPGRNLQFWVDVQIPANAPPGRYTGQLAIRFRRESWMPAGKLPPEIGVPLTVVVRRFTLPEVTPLRNTAFFQPRLPPGMSADRAAMRQWYAGFAAHRQAPDPVLPAPEIQVLPGGRLKIDATQWEQTACLLLDELHVPQVFLPVWSTTREPGAMQGLYFLWHYPAVTAQSWFGARIDGEDQRPTAEFQERFGSYLEHMAALVRRHGWTGRVQIATMDEPYTYHTGDRQRDIPANNYAVLRHYVELVRRRGPGLVTFATADPTPELAGLIDHWCLRNLTTAAEARRRAAAHHETFTFCNNYRTFIDYPAVSARSLGWLAWKIGAQGWLTFDTLAGLETAWEGPVTVYPAFHGGAVWGMGQMFYPQPQVGAPLPSLRWELMRKGCEDYEYLWLLRQRLATLPPAAAGQEPARQAEEFLKTAAEAVVGGAGDPETASAATRPNAADNRVPQQLRDRAAELLEELGP